jgi:predicted AAA+ superfamily ATPase
MSNEVDKFLHKYEAQASVSDRKHYAKRMPMSMSEYHRYHTAMDVYEYESYMQREPYIEMYIPQHRFQELVAREEHFDRLVLTQDYAGKILNDQLIDERVRNSNPSVKKAYEKYKMLLEIARK